jgi:hypothetical protein
LSKIAAAPGTRLKVGVTVADGTAFVEGDRVTFVGTAAEQILWRAAYLFQYGVPDSQNALAKIPIT